MGLHQYVTLGRTPILIQNNPEVLSQPELTKLNADLARWLDNWKAAWETKNIDAYISSYAEDFESMNMNRDQWKTYKARLIKQYQTIAIRLSKPSILADRDRVVVRFLQEYTSDRHADFGEKVLFIKKVGTELKIVGEQWTQETSKIAREEIEATTNNTTGASVGSGLTSAAAAAQ